MRSDDQGYERMRLDFTGIPRESVASRRRLKCAVIPLGGAKLSTGCAGLCRASCWTLPGFCSRKSRKISQLRISSTGLYRVN